jgi:hypothetical protein
MTTNFLVDIFLTDVINIMPISVGRGDAMRMLARVTSKYTLIDGRIRELRVRTARSFERLCTSSPKPRLTKKKIAKSLIKAPTDAIAPAKSTFCPLAMISSIAVAATDVNE